VVTRCYSARWKTSAPFSIVDGGGNLLEQMNVVIQPSSFLQFDLRFAPSAAGSFDGSLIINTDDSANPSIVITLSGTANPVANDDPILPAVTALKGNFPNPFNPPLHDQLQASKSRFRFHRHLQPQRPARQDPG
jgi:hypothetical protein